MLACFVLTEELTPEVRSFARRGSSAHRVPCFPCQLARHIPIVHDYWASR